MANLEEVFCNTKFTENGDKAYESTLSSEIDILFKAPYYTKHLDEIPSLPDSERTRLLSMLIRDPRDGFGWKTLGRELMKRANLDFSDTVLAGRYDDIWKMWIGTGRETEALEFLKTQIEAGNELAKKWMPRYSSKNLLVARHIAAQWGMGKQKYGHFIKAQTTEKHLSCGEPEEIIFEHVPSLASIKYANTFKTKEVFAERYAEYLKAVSEGKAELKVSTTTPYDIYKNRGKIDADLFFNELPKISGSWLPIVDTSGSMEDSNDSAGKALALGHYLSKCSTYCSGKVVSFSSEPTLLTLGVPNTYRIRHRTYTQTFPEGISQYEREIESMYTGDCSNTNLGRVMDLLKDLTDVPEWLIILSDMEFDAGSTKSKEKTMQLFKERGYKTRIIWWNFNTRSQTCPETDSDGNIFLSGYSPVVLKFLETGFDCHALLEKLLTEYAQKKMAK